MLLCAIDADSKKNGWAIYDGFRLAFCGLASRSEYPEFVDMFKVDLTIVELPQVYQRRKSKGNPNDLVAITASGAELAGRIGAPVEYYRPRTWKGNLDKTLVHQRTRAHFEHTEDFNSLYVWDAIEYRFGSEQASEVCDAASFGLWWARKCQVRRPSPDTLR